MALSTAHLHGIIRSLLRPSLLHFALLFSCGMLIVQGEGSSSKATPLTRRERNADCAQSCAQVSEMARCLRVACRKNAMGSLIRFGKRDKDGASTEDESEMGSRLPLTRELPNSVHSGNIFKKLLRRDLGVDRDQGHVRSDVILKQLAVDTFSPYWQQNTLLLPHHKNDHPLWLLQTNRRRLTPMENFLFVRDNLPSHHTPDYLERRETNLLGDELSLNSGLSDDLLPLNFQETPSKEKQESLVREADQIMTRHQRGLPKHLIRFG